MTLVTEIWFGFCCLILLKLWGCWNDGEWHPNTFAWYMVLGLGSVQLRPCSIFVKMRLQTILNHDHTTRVEWFGLIVLARTCWVLLVSKLWVVSFGSPALSFYILDEARVSFQLFACIYAALYSLYCKRLWDNLIVYNLYFLLLSLTAGRNVDCTDCVATVVQLAWKLFYCIAITLLEQASLERSRLHTK